MTSLSNQLILQNTSFPKLISFIHSHICKFQIHKLFCCEVFNCVFFKEGSLTNCIIYLGLIDSLQDSHLQLYLNFPACIILLTNQALYSQKMLIPTYQHISYCNFQQRIVFDLIKHLFIRNSIFSILHHLVVLIIINGVSLDFLSLIQLRRQNWLPSLPDSINLSPFCCFPQYLQQLLDFYARM